MKIVYALAALVIIGRFTIEPRLTNIPSWNLTYEAIAHMFVGGVLWESIRTQGWRLYRGYWLVFWSLAVFELAMFMVQKNGVDVFDPVRTVLLILMYFIYPYLPPSWKG
jgi:hypothetical protein